MAQGREYTKTQKKIINRYYEHKDTIMLSKLAELASELYLATEAKQADKLWKRAETALRQVGLPESRIAHLLQARDPALLAQAVGELS